MFRPGMRIIVWGLCICLLAACTQPSQTAQFRVNVIVDGQTVALSSNTPLSVRQLLQQNNIRVGDLDRLNPSDITPITDGLVITIVRVENRAECQTEEMGYGTETLKTPDLKPGESRIMRAGQKGTSQVCYDVVYEDGKEKSRVLSSTNILTPPVNQIVAIGVDSTKIEPVPITGMLAYISNGQARAIVGSSLTQTTLPTGGNLDGYVFSLSPSGRQLLFTRRPDDPKKQKDTLNELWVLLDTSDPAAQPVKLILENILTAEWVPGQPYNFIYSTLRPREEPPGYQAYNDLFLATLDTTTGKVATATPIIKAGPTSVWGVWGTQFEYSPDGKQLAWAQADGVGLVNIKDGKFNKVLDFSVYTTTLSNKWLWIPSLAWSADSATLIATIHGKPLGSENTETSPVFDLAVLQVAGGFAINPVISQTGMWAGPRYSPLIQTNDTITGYIAFLQARDKINSVNSEYDLMLADRDGSNQRAIFPSKDKPGLRPLDDDRELAWSPDAQHIAVVYQGNIYVVDITTGRGTAVTVEGNVQHPRWVK